MEEDALIVREADSHAEKDRTEDQKVIVRVIIMLEKAVQKMARACRMEAIARTIALVATAVTVRADIVRADTITAADMLREITMAKKVEDLRTHVTDITARTADIAVILVTEGLDSIQVRFA